MVPGSFLPFLLGHNFGRCYGLIQDFACGRVSPQNINSTHIVLIPKSANPSVVSQFQFISLCNYSYKKKFQGVG